MNLEAVVKNYHNRRHFLQNVHLSHVTDACRPFAFMKNSGADPNPTLYALLQSINSSRNNGKLTLNRKQLDKPPSDFLLVGARSLDLKTASQSLNDESCFKFTSVADPHIRALSAFHKHILNKGPVWKKLASLLRINPERDLSFSAFLDILASEPKALNMSRQWRPQILEISYGNIQYDFIGTKALEKESLAFITHSIFGQPYNFDDIPKGLFDISLTNNFIDDFSNRDKQNILHAFEEDFEMLEDVQSSGIQILGNTFQIELSSTEKKVDWVDNLQQIGDEHGFFKHLGAKHSALYVGGGKDLIVSFENLDHVFEGGADRMPWGYQFVSKQGWSMLGLMAHDWTWYRDEDVFDFFDGLRDEGFFDQFDNVVFYGASMGAYAAAVFSSAAPNSKVILISPQATLDPKIAPFEKRYSKAKKNCSFEGRYSYAPELVKKASKAYLFVDPFHKLDRQHAELFKEASNLNIYNCYFFGHRIASLWLQIGILKDIITQSVNGTLSPSLFYNLLRKRKDNIRYHREMVERLAQKGHDQLLVKYASILKENGVNAPKINIALRKAQSRI